ncbi:hypothetical protein [Ekhidna sp.]|uniref:hypothetical protein n=1 Tax=Ekhidna sp. TaxID=2608089 RepID=UPI0032EDAFD6
MKIDKTLLIEECLELIAMHKNHQCDQKETEPDLSWYLRIQGLISQIREEPDRNSAKDRSEVLMKALNELIEEEKC